MQKTILVTGAKGQIGTALVKALREQYGLDKVIATDIRSSTNEEGLFEQLDILDDRCLAELVDTYHVGQIYHLAAILSAKGEEQPLKTWNINMTGFFNVLEVARKAKLEKVFFPSSIGVHGQSTPRNNVPQNTTFEPNSVYGISKLSSELWCQYYHQKYGLDIRSLRYPGLISYESLPGGGTTDYAVDIFYKAMKGENFQCFLKENTRLPMMYMPDAIRATLELMEAPAGKLSIRTAYNIAAVNFTPQEIYSTILKHYPSFKIHYQPDFRQAIADSWSDSIDDSFAQNDWGWKAKYDLSAICEDMFKQLSKKEQTFTFTSN